MIVLQLPKEERIEIKNSKGLRIVSYLRRWESDAVMILCSGGTPLNTIPNFKEFLELYYEMLPINILRFDFLGSGESDGEKLIDIRERINDLTTVMDYCNRRWERIILYAPSMAALIGILALQNYTKVDKLITVNGMFNLDEIGWKVKSKILFYKMLRPSTFKKQVEFIEKNTNFNRITIPTFIVYGTKDTWIKPKQSIDFYNTNPDKKILYKVEEADHYMTDSSDANIKRAREFLKSLRDWILAS